MKKKDAHASERISAMMLGGALCSGDQKPYKGPIFARQKRSRKMWIFILLIAGTYGSWRLLKSYRPEIARKIERDWGMRSPASQPSKDPSEDSSTEK